jgi:glutathione S-transferase
VIVIAGFANLCAIVSHNSKGICFVRYHGISTTLNIKKMASNPPQTTIATLHHLSSSQSLRVLWALEELKEANGTQYVVKKYSRVKSLAPVELKSVHPLGKSPILTVEPISGNTSASDTKTLIESRIILLFIADNYANGLWTPKSATSVERDLFFQEYANGTLRTKIDFTLIFEIIPQHVPFFIRPLARLLVTPVVNVMKQGLPDVYQELEDALSEEKPWFAGEKIGLADFNMSWGMDTAEQRKYFDGGKYPKLRDWHERVKSRPAYKRAVELGPSYDLVNYT